MTQLLPDEKDALAALMVAEVKSEEAWAELFASSQAALATVAQEALHEVETGQSEPLTRPE